MHAIRKLAAITTFAALTLTGCSGDRLTGTANDTLNPGSLLSAANVERPWKGICDVSSVITGLSVAVTGTCQIAHLGRVSVTADQTLAFGPGGISYTNTAVYVAANGDKLETSNTGTATPIPNPNGSPVPIGLILSGEETASGGTGRFADASGSARLDGAVFFTGPNTTTGSYSIAGQLSY